MLRLELTFLHLASGGGCNGRGCAKGQKYQLQRSFSYREHTRAGGPYAVGPVPKRRPILKSQSRLQPQNNPGYVMNERG
jgi:hypothetical protein